MWNRFITHLWAFGLVSTTQRQLGQPITIKQVKSEDSFCAPSVRRRLPCLCRRPSFANRPSVTSSACYTALGAAAASEGTFQGQILKISTPAMCMEFPQGLFSMSKYPPLPRHSSNRFGRRPPPRFTCRTSGMSVPSRLTAMIECANLETIAQNASLKLH